MRGWAISYFGTRGDGLRLGVKDLIDVEGTRTTAGSRLLLSTAPIAEKDAEIVALARLGGAEIVAKTVLNELAFGTSGMNPWFPSAANPLNRWLVPGGSSSGSAVGVALGELDVAFGSDTGGSIRIPSACCGLFGLKTTTGRIPLEGVRPLAPSFDTVGPIAADVARLEAGMALMEPGFSAKRVSRPRVAVIADSGPEEEIAAFSKLLSLAKSRVGLVEDPGMGSARQAATCILLAEALKSNQPLLAESHRLDPAVAARFLAAERCRPEDLISARGTALEFASKVEEIFLSYDFLALPTLRVPVPSIIEAVSVSLNANTIPFNLLGLPAVAIPVRLDVAALRYLGAGPGFAPAGWRDGGAEPMPISLQIVGKRDSDEQLVGFAKLIENCLAEI